MVQPETICHPFVTQHFLDPGSGDVLERSRVSWTEYGAYLLCGENITCLRTALVAAIQFDSKWQRCHDSIPDRSHDHVSAYEISMILTQQAFPIFYAELPQHFLFSYVLWHLKYHYTRSSQSFTRRSPVHGNLWEQVNIRHLCHITLISGTQHARNSG